MYQSNKEIFSGSEGSEIHSTYASDLKYLLEDMHQLTQELTIQVIRDLSDSPLSEL